MHVRDCISAVSRLYLGYISHQLGDTRPRSRDEVLEAGVEGLAVVQVLARNLKVRVAGGVAARVQLRAARRREGAAERRVRVRTGRVKGLVDALSDGRNELDQTPPEGLLPPRLQQRGLEGS